MRKDERICEIGYPAQDHQRFDQALISIHNPALINAGADFIQIIISIDGAISLRAALRAFLKRHGVRAN